MAVRLGAADVAELDAEAVELAMTRSELVRLAITEHLLRRRRLRDPWSALEAEGKLIPATHSLDLTSPLPTLPGPSMSKLLDIDRADSL